MHAHAPTSLPGRITRCYGVETLNSYLRTWGISASMRGKGTREVIALEGPITIGDDNQRCDARTSVSDLPHLLVRKRTQRGDSQADLAAFINRWMEEHGHDLTRPQMSTSQAAISKIEAGLSRPIPAKIPAFASYLGLSEGQTARAASPDALGESVAVLREQVINERAMRRQVEQTNEDLLSELANLQGDYQRLQAENRKMQAALAKLEARQNAVEQRVTAATTRRRSRA